MIDASLFTREVQAMTPSLYRVGMSLLRRQSDAEDAVQQALLKAWAARHRAGEDYFRPWLMRIVINECRNIQRQRKRCFLPQTFEPIHEDSPDTYAGIYAAMDALPEGMRVTLLLKYMEGYTEKDMAQALHISVTAVKGRLHRAREALKRQLKEEGVMFE